VCDIETTKILVNEEEAKAHWGAIAPRKKTDTVISYYYYWYSALGPVWADTRVQSGDWYGSDTLHPGQVLRGSLPLLSPAF